MSHTIKGANMSSPTVQMVTHPQRAPEPIDPATVQQRETAAVNEMVACLQQYQDMCRNEWRAKKLWRRADKAITAWCNAHEAKL